MRNNHLPACSALDRESWNRIDGVESDAEAPPLFGGPAQENEMKPQATKRSIPYLQAGGGVIDVPAASRAPGQFSLGRVGFLPDCR